MREVSPNEGGLRLTIRRKVCEVETRGERGGMNYWQTSLVRLRGVEPEDGDVFWEWNQDSEMARNLEFVWPPVSIAQVRAWAGTEAKRKLEDDSFRWVIENLEGTPVGFIHTHNCQPRNGVFKYGIGIAGPHRGKGYARAAALLVLRYYFKELRYQKVTVQMHSANGASRALHEGLGFVREGTVRRAIFTDGRYLDELFYGMTVEEWQQRYDLGEG